MRDGDVESLPFFTCAARATLTPAGLYTRSHYVISYCIIDISYIMLYCISLSCLISPSYTILYNIIGYSVVLCYSIVCFIFYFIFSVRRVALGWVGLGWVGLGIGLSESKLVWACVHSGTSGTSNTFTTNLMCLHMLEQKGLEVQQKCSDFSFSSIRRVMVS